LGGKEDFQAPYPRIGDVNGPPITRKKKRKKEKEKQTTPQKTDKPKEKNPKKNKQKTQNLVAGWKGGR